MNLNQLTNQDLKTMSVEEINELARAAQKDIEQLRAEGRAINEENFTLALWYIVEIFRDDIARLVDRNLSRFNRTGDNDHGETAYERRLKKKILDAVEYYDGERDFRNLVKSSFRQATGEFYQRRSSIAKNEVSFDYVTAETDSRVERKVTIFIPDVRENVEKAVIGKEMRSALYARFGHCARRRFVLERLDDMINPKNIDIAREMCDVFIGTSEAGNKRFINRFKIEMQQFIVSSFEDKLVA